MTNEKRTHVIYWTATVIIVLFEGLMPALTSNTELAVQGIRHLGYPDYFRVLLTVFKVCGAAVLLLPFSSRIKEWAYAGFGFTMISAFISHWAVDGLSGQTFFPLFMLSILALSYIFSQRRRRYAANRPVTFKPTHHVVSSLPQ